MAATFKLGDIVWCHHLHDGTAPQRMSAPNKDGDCEFRIAGKARRVLVLGEIPWIWLETAIDTKEPIGETGCTLYNATGNLGYMVLSLQSDRPPPFVPWECCPGLLEPEKISYVDLFGLLSCRMSRDRS